MAENMTFNTVAGQPVDRELLILFVNTGSDSAAVWSRHDQNHDEKAHHYAGL